MANFSSTYPSTKPVFQSDFANGGRIDPRITFSRSDTPPTYAAPSAVHYWSNEKHLSSENLLLQSEDFTTSWSSIDMTGSSGATAPDGGTDAYTITASTGSGQKPRRVQSLLGKLLTSTQYTLVGHFKAGTATHGWMSFRGTNSNNYAYAQIEFASPSSVSTGGAGFAGISGTVTALGSSWYRLTLTATTGSDVSGAYAFFGPNDGSAFGTSGYPTWTSAGETLEVWGAQISSTNTKVYDSPTTTQIARSYASSLKSVSYAGQPRFEYSPTDSASMGLLIEGQAQNLISYSSDSTQWTKAFSSLTGSAAVAPDGSLSASAWVPDTSLNGHYTHPTSLPTVASGTTYTGSVYVKSAGLTLCQLTWSSSGFGAGYKVNFNLSGSGSVVATAGGASGTISQCGNGWFRLTITAAATSSGSGVMVIGAIDSETSGRLPSYSGDGYNGLLIYGIQQETGSFASSLISTSGSQVTRAADSASMVDANLFDNGGGGLVAEYDMFAASETSYVAHLNKTSGGTNGGGVAITNRYVYVENNYLNVGNLPSNTFHKVAASWEPSSQKISRNGGAAAEDTSTVVPSGIDKLYIGQRQDGNEPVNGHIKRLAIFNQPLSSTELAAVTS